jgi:hypothetical protein
MILTIAGGILLAWLAWSLLAYLSAVLLDWLSHHGEVIFLLMILGAGVWFVVAWGLIIGW